VARLMRLGWSAWLYRKKVRRFDEVLRLRLCEMGDARALWLPAFDGVAATRGLEGECETHLPAVQAGAIHCTHQAAAKVARRQRVARSIAVGWNQSWSMDLMSAKLADGRSFRILTVVDQFTREWVCLEADCAMTGMKVAQALQRAKVERGSLPATITMDNGSEFCSRALKAWVMGNGRTVVFHSARPARGERVHVGTDGMSIGDNLTAKSPCDAALRQDRSRGSRSQNLNVLLLRKRLAKRRRRLRIWHRSNLGGAVVHNGGLWWTIFTELIGSEKRSRRYRSGGQQRGKTSYDTLIRIDKEGITLLVAAVRAYPSTGMSHRFKSQALRVRGVLHLSHRLTHSVMG
jgi:integrase-like protein